MFNFFVEDNSREGNCYYIEGHDFNHIKNVLRMHVGDTILPHVRTDTVAAGPSNSIGTTLRSLLPNCNQEDYQTLTGNIGVAVRWHGSSLFCAEFPNIH